MTTISTNRQPSPPAAAKKPTVSDQISALGSRLGLTRTRSRDSQSTADSLWTAVEPQGPGQGKADSINEQKDRSVSRGREFRSSGRGGAGNIRPSSSSTSASRDRPSGPDDFSVTRGREPRAQPDCARTNSVSIGRGGAGNIRAADADAPALHDAAYEQQLLAEAAHAASGIRSSGRGGVGNMTRSRSENGRALPPARVANDSISRVLGAEYAHRCIPEHDSFSLLPDRVTLCTSIARDLPKLLRSSEKDSSDYEN